jgi:hypothetical protein
VYSYPQVFDRPAGRTKPRAQILTYLVQSLSLRNGEAEMNLSMNYTLEVDEQRRIIREKIYGLWKADTARSYYEDFKKEVAPLTSGKWAKLINLNNWKLSYPEVVDIIGEHLKWCRENGMVLSVNVIDNSITENQLKKMFTMGGTEKISHLFRTMEEADKFLKSNGF